MKGAGVIERSGALRTTGVPQDAGGAEAGSTQGSRYVQEGMGTCRPAVSEGLFQPFPALMDAAVKVGTGKVGMAPVGV